MIDKISQQPQQDNVLAQTGHLVLDFNEPSPTCKKVECRVVMNPDPNLALNKGNDEPLIKETETEKETKKADEKKTKETDEKRKSRVDPSIGNPATQKAQKAQKVQKAQKIQKAQKDLPNATKKSDPTTKTDVTSKMFEENGLQKPLQLERAWCFWFDQYIGPNKSPDQYRAAQTRIATFDTIQKFWQWYNHLPAIGELRSGSSYHLMRSGVRPLWEDKSNVHGGSLSFRFATLEEGSEAWLTLILHMIGECLITNKDINGISISTRRNGCVITIWTGCSRCFDVGSFYNHIFEVVIPDHCVASPFSYEGFSFFFHLIFFYSSHKIFFPFFLICGVTIFLFHQLKKKLFFSV